MFDFLNEDWFVIVLEVVFLILIIYDINRYIKTKRKDYLVNIFITLGFAIWTLYPMYTSYFGWEDSQKSEIIMQCEESNTNELCKCVSDRQFKQYTYLEYMKIDKNSTDYKEYIENTKADCIDESWF